MKSEFFQKIFAILLFLIGISAIGGGIGLILTNGLGMPVYLLNESLFQSYILPGLLLVIIVGGTHILAAILFWINHKFKFEAAAAAGFGLIIWLFTEMYIIRQAHLLQYLYFSLGILNITGVLLFQKKGGDKNY